jgi:hypothetical protein
MKREERERSQTSDRLRKEHENQIISGCMSANGSQGIKPEGFRRPNANRFRKHVSRPYRPGL